MCCHHLNLVKEAILLRFHEYGFTITYKRQNLTAEFLVIQLVQSSCPLFCNIPRALGGGVAL